MMILSCSYILLTIKIACLRVQFQMIIPIRNCSEANQNLTILVAVTTNLVTYYMCNDPLPPLAIPRLGVESYVAR